MFISYASIIRYHRKHKTIQKKKTNSLADSLPYFYIAPYEGWKRKIDPYNESFEDYAHRTHRTRTILEALVGIGNTKGERSKTKSLTYQVK